MPLHFFSFFKFKLRDIKWTVMFTVIIMASVLSWLVSFSTSSNINASVNNYSKTLTFIRVDHYVQGPGINDYAVIPSNVTAAIESMQHVKKLHKLYMFYIARVVRNNINISGVPSENLTLFLMGSAIALGLSETIPPFIIDIRSGHLPINGSEIALTVPGDYYKLGDEIEVAFNGTITNVKISGFLTTSLLSPVQMVVHKDFLLRMPGGDYVRNEALRGECTVLFVEVDDIYNVDEVLENLRELLGWEEEGWEEWEIRDVYEITYDEYLLKRTLELSENSAFVTILLTSGALSFSIVLIMITNYFNINIRKWEVGLLRSFGLSNNEIITTYILHSLVVTVFGVVAAFSVAHIVVTFIERLLINALGFGNTISAVTIELTPLTMLLTFTLAIVMGAVSTFIIVSMTLRKPIEDQLREF